MPAVDQDWRKLIQVIDTNGEPINRDWLPSRNPRGIYLPSLPTGRYRLTMEPRIRDTQGRMLQIFLQGWITIP